MWELQTYYINTSAEATLRRKLCFQNSYETVIRLDGIDHYSATVTRGENVNAVRYIRDKLKTVSYFRYYCLSNAVYDSPCKSASLYTDISSFRRVTEAFALSGMLRGADW